MVLECEPCLVVGGGRVAERKVDALLEAGARVTVVAHEATEGLRLLADAGAIALRLGEVTEDDLREPVLVVAATDDADLHAWLSAECRNRRIPVNVVDVPALCTFTVPATIRRGPLTLALMTGGEAPALAKKLRRMLEEQVGPEYGALAVLMGGLRREVKERLHAIEDRTAAWTRLVESEELLALLRGGRPDEARALARCILGLERGE